MWIASAAGLVVLLLILFGWGLRKRAAIKLQRLTQRIEEQKKIEEELKNLATTDELTGTYNRRAILEIAQTEFEKCLDEGLPFSVLLIDIDHFKQVNDQYGHEVGDRVIRAVVNVCGDTLRLKDIGYIGRLGGEEFVILLPGVDQIKAHVVAEQLRECVEKQPIQCVENTWYSATVSVGLATMKRSEKFDALLNRADLAMYQAKKAGRNRVNISREPVAG